MPYTLHTNDENKNFHFVNDSLNLIAKEDVQFGYFRSLEKCRSSIRLYKESVHIELDQNCIHHFSEITSLNRIRKLQFDSHIVYCSESFDIVCVVFAI